MTVYQVYPKKNIIEVIENASHLDGGKIHFPNGDWETAGFISKFFTSKDDAILYLKVSLERELKSLSLREKEIIETLNSI